MKASEFRRKVATIIEKLSEEEIRQQTVTIICTDGISRYTASWGTLQVLESCLRFQDLHCTDSSALIEISYSVIADVVDSIPTSLPLSQTMTKTDFVRRAHVITGSAYEAELSMLHLVICFTDGQEQITPAWTVDIDTEPTAVRYIPVQCDSRANPISVPYSVISDLYDFSRPQSRLA